MIQFLSVAICAAGKHGACAQSPGIKNGSPSSEHSPLTNFRIALFAGSFGTTSFVAVPHVDTVYVLVSAMY